ncbi:Hypothetical predicted protein [Paramuricea clavata]|uniref:Uncharacterized protein n=1 Tax=Paramuricea clavata TaxID=317549 RepID=A0A7D9DMQ1_PARCT|nr:Hypothetical predicted protein [Paramuricea clavata]
MSKELANCMRDKYNHDYARILYDAIANESISDPTQTTSGSQISGIFDPSGELFRYILIFSTVGACLMFIAGLGWDFVRRGKKIACKSEKKLGSVEEQLVSELHTVFMNWKERRATESFDLQLESKA